MNIRSIKAGELSFAAACVFSAIGIRMQVNAGLGISMVAAPAYILSAKLSWLTQGNAEWMIQGAVFLLMCVLIRRIAWKKIWSFVIAIPYGWIFDGISKQMVNVRGEGFAGNLLLFLAGCLFLSFGIALFFQSYLPCQVHEMFVKTISEEFHLEQSKVKSAYDFTFLGLSLIMSIAFFRKLDGIGIGTVICTLVNGPLIGRWKRFLDGKINYEAAFPTWKSFFE